MRQDVIDLRRFYATPLGQAAARMLVGKVVEAWGSLAGLDVLGLGYPMPLVAGLEARATVLAMPAAQGVEAWPVAGANRACLADEAALPFANAAFDRVLALHALEESDTPVDLLRETARVLAPSGRLIVAVTARHGLWADAETTPFGQGRSFSRRQLEALLSEAGLQPLGWNRALYAPPLQRLHRWTAAFESLGARLAPPFAGVLLMEAGKQTFAVIPKASRQRVRAMPVLRPAPFAREAA
jgi:SAM-dependent methyltransferase